MGQRVQSNLEWIESLNEFGTTMWNKQTTELFYKDDGGGNIRS